jgi:Ca2+/Na+ antiporter
VNRRARSHAAQKRLAAAELVIGIGLAGLAWVQILTAHSRHSDSGVWFSVGFGVVVSAIMLALLLRATQAERISRWGLAVLSTYALMATVFVFASLYWYNGEPPNFNQPLTHLDAIYFALGTLSTAGTGSLNATTEVTRAIQSVQMVVDLVLVLVAITMAVARVIGISRGDKTRS